MAADVEAGARCEWEEDDWRSLWRYRGLATEIMMPPAARTSTGNTVMQTHLDTDTHIFITAHFADQRGFTTRNEKF